MIRLKQFQIWYYIRKTKKYPIGPDFALDWLDA